MPLRAAKKRIKHTHPKITRGIVKVREHLKNYFWQWWKFGDDDALSASFRSNETATSDEHIFWCILAKLAIQNRKNTYIKCRLDLSKHISPRQHYNARNKRKKRKSVKTYVFTELFHFSQKYITSSRCYITKSRSNLDLLAIDITCL